MAKPRPIQNPYSRKIGDMRSAVRAQPHRRIEKNIDLPPETNEIPEVFKTPWLRRVLKRLGNK